MNTVIITLSHNKAGKDYMIVICEHRIMGEECARKGRPALFGHHRCPGVSWEYLNGMLFADYRLGQEASQEYLMSSVVRFHLYLLRGEARKSKPANVWSIN